MRNSNMNQAVLPAGTRYLSVSRVLDKLSRQKSWLYAKLQNDPSFPKPLRLDSRLCFVESEIDAWVVRQAQRVDVAAA